MKKVYKIEVDCPSCAAKMENAAAKTEGVRSAVVNFMMQKMVLEFDDGADVSAIMAQVVKSCRKATRDGEIFL